MAAFISKKLSLFLLLCAFSAAGGIVFLTHYALTGPKLGPVYDILLGFRPSPPVSWEILLIETDEVIEPGDIFPVLMTLSEMGASDLIVEVPVLGSGSGRMENGLELGYRVNDEFNLLERNIRNLFEGIRLGLVSPTESPEYVENLVELAVRGRDRLNAAIVKQDEAGTVLSAQAQAVFGRAVTAVDMRALSLASLSEDIPWYSRPRYDGDRVFRRIAPVKREHKTEHIVYHALKPRWTSSNFELTEEGQVMVNRFEWQGEEIEHRFPLDRDGNIIVEKPGRGGSFRRLNMEQFRSYDLADRAMARLLKDSEALGVYAETMPERIPLILYEYAESLKEELLKLPTPQKHAAWITAREDYIASLDEFLYSPSEMILVNRYEELIATEWLDDGGIAKMQDLRDELIRAFVTMREKHREFVGLHSLLAEAIASSFCIMGPAGPLAPVKLPVSPPQAAAPAPAPAPVAPSSPVMISLAAMSPPASVPVTTSRVPFSMLLPALSAGELNIPESSALLANALLTGMYITPADSRHIIFWSLIASFFVLLCIHALRPAALLITGLATTLVCGAAFGVSFIITAYWIDPFIPMAACLTGTLILTITRFFISFGRMQRFRLAYSGAVNNDMLRQLVRLGRPPLSDTLCTQAVIIAVKKVGMSGKEDQGTALEAAKAAAEFRQEFSAVFKRNGALILGFENDIALACFGSPPQRLCGKDDLYLMMRATNSIREILGHPASAQWYFGIESGECAFSWSAKTGYTANGHAVVRARIFSLLAARHQVRAVIGSSAWKDSDLLMKKISTYAGENFYELVI